MIKAELKEKWGQYCDTNALVDSVMALLTKYQFNNTEHGVCTMLDTYFENKHELIDLFKRDSHYIGDMRIMVDAELERTLDSEKIHSCLDNLFKKSGSLFDTILKRKDEQGKTILDYYKVGKKTINVSEITQEHIKQRINSLSPAIISDIFDSDCYTRDSRFRKVICEDLFDYFTTYRFSFINESIKNKIDRKNSDLKIEVGLKTSRALNKIACYYGLDNDPRYRKFFAEYSDLVTSLKRKVKFYISLNPLDYLTMSIGVNWKSCHNITYHGSYCGGCMSYMLDKTSIITYVYTKESTNPEFGKLYRNMFHWDNGLLLQNRIYPQGNDGNTDLYTVFRQIVQKEFAEMLGLEENKWIKKRELGSISTEGVHYPDYNYKNSCNVSYPKEMQPEDHTIHVGHERICAFCGQPLSDGEYHSLLSHAECQ